MKKNLLKIISLILVISVLFSLVACSNGLSIPSLSDPNNSIVTENTIYEKELTEDVIFEHITEEIYLEEIVIAEDKISELLLAEDTINEVVLCSTVYVSQENIEEFAKNSQIASLFENDIDFSSVFKRVAVGTGVIVTLVVLKVAMKGTENLIASIVCAAADESFKFATSGAAIGSLYGGLTGATDEVDKSGKTSAVIGFATATAGLIVSIVSLIAEIPSGGSSTVTAATGVKLVISGIGVLAGTAGTISAGRNAVKTFTATDVDNIDWERIDWNKVGVSAAQKSIENAADGYMWGSIIGAVKGGADGYDFYHKYSTPYTKYNDRLMQTPTKDGHWTGERGESDFILDNPIELPDGTKITKITYKNAVPDFSPYEKAQVKILKMSNKRYGSGGNFEQADEQLAKIWTKMRYGDKTWTARDVEAYRTANNLTWHEMSNMKSMQLVPTEVNSTFTHYGGVAEYNAMIGQKGDIDFD